MTGYKFRFSNLVAYGVILISIITLTYLYVVDTIVPINVHENVQLESLDHAYAKVADIVVPSSVIIAAGSSRGSGVVVGDGLVLTNDHVVAGHTAVTVSLSIGNGKYKSFNGKVLPEPDTTKYSEIDLALIKITSLTPFTAPAIVLGHVDDVDFGVSGLMVGNPNNIGLLASKAMVANPTIAIDDDFGNTFNHIIVDAPVNSGNSGGGFYNMRGELIGIITMRQVSDGTSNKDIVFGIGFAIRIDDICSYLGRYSEMVKSVA